jgi:GNAT superfamily N-acetyltransferase
MLPYEESNGYKITSRGRVIGGLIVWIFEHGHNRLGTIFVDPDAQDQGVGSRAWAFVEQTYPDARSWTLDTPGWATKNHHFYQKKCGFAKVGEEVRGDCVIFVYRKEMP